MSFLDPVKHLLRKPVEIDEGKLAEARMRGEAARRLMNEELLVEAFERVEGVYMDAWKRSGALDTDIREKAWTAIQLLADLRNHLTAVIRDGEIATRQIERFAQS